MEFNSIDAARIVSDLTDSGHLPAISDPHWALQGGGNFDGIGSTDWLWRHLLTGQNVIWLMGNQDDAPADEPLLRESLPLPWVNDADWQLKDIIDVDFDDRSEIRWYNDSSEKEVVWYINEAGVSRRQLVNEAPQVEAGADIETTVFNWVSTPIAGQADDPEGDPLTLVWSQATGPGTVVFEDSNSAETSVNFSQPGVYELKLAVEDGNNPAQEDTVTVTVNRPSETRILPLGDSITAGIESFDSYRKPLWQRLQAEGYDDVNFVGSQTAAVNTGGGSDSSFDPDHEGHGGWRADDILYGYGHDRSDNDRPDLRARGRLNDWLPISNPDIALIHLGTNDLLYRQSPESTVQELGQVIDGLRLQNPNMAIFVAQVIPDFARESETIAFNALIPGLVTQKNRANSPVFLVDHWTGYDVYGDNSDGIHPNAIGETKMAERWLDGLEELFEDGHTTGASESNEVA